MTLAAPRLRRHSNLARRRGDAVVVAHQPAYTDRPVAVLLLGSCEVGTVSSPDHDCEAARVGVVDSEVEKRRRPIARCGVARSDYGALDGLHAPDVPKCRVPADGSRAGNTRAISNAPNQPWPLRRERQRTRPAQERVGKSASETRILLWIGSRATEPSAVSTRLYITRRGQVDLTALELLRRRASEYELLADWHVERSAGDPRYWTLPMRSWQSRSCFVK